MFDILFEDRSRWVKQLRPDSGRSWEQLFLERLRLSSVVHNPMQPRSSIPFTTTNKNCHINCPCGGFQMHYCKQNMHQKQFIHLGYFCNASSSPLLLRGTSDTARILCRSFMLKHHRQLRMKDLPKVPMWWLNPRPFEREVTNLPMSHHIPQL